MLSPAEADCIHLEKSSVFRVNYFFPPVFLGSFSDLFFFFFPPNYHDSLISREKNVNLKETPSGSMVTLATPPHMLPSSIYYRNESTQVTTSGRKVLRCPCEVDKLMVIPSEDTTISRCLTPWKENSGKKEIKLPPKNQP